MIGLQLWADVFQISQQRSERWANKTNNDSKLQFHRTTF